MSNKIKRPMNAYMLFSKEKNEVNVIWFNEKIKKYMKVKFKNKYLIDLQILILSTMVYETIHISLFYFKKNKKKGDNLWM